MKLMNEVNTCLLRQAVLWTDSLEERAASLDMLSMKMLKERIEKIKSIPAEELSPNEKQYLLFLIETWENPDDPSPKWVVEGHDWLLEHKDVLFPLTWYRIP